MDTSKPQEGVWIFKNVTENICRVFQSEVFIIRVENRQEDSRNGSRKIIQDAVSSVGGGDGGGLDHHGYSGDSSNEASGNWQRDWNGMKEGVKDDPNFLVSVTKCIVVLFAQLGKS